MHDVFLYEAYARVSVKQKPVPIDRNSRNQSNGNAKAVAVELPVWAKNAAKLLNGGSDGLDWIALAKKFGNTNWSNSSLPSS